MRQQAKTTIYRLAPVVMLAITVAAPHEVERRDEEHHSHLGAGRSGRCNIRCTDLFGRRTLEMVLS